ncbi:MAG: divergent PAP2 family protein [Patescibacteria group bacterium]
MFELILIPVIVGIATQIIKLSIDGIPNNLTWQHLVRDYGGMPSSHAAFVTSLATVVGLTQRFDSAAFAIAFVLWVIVVRDAIGFRREIGDNAALTNRLAKEIFKNKKTITYLPERVGHGLMEVIIGTGIGIGLTILLYLIFIIL